MKKALIFHSFLLFVSNSLAARSPDPVLDVAGKALRNGLDYYILPVVGRGQGGGLTLAPTRNKTCPLDVVQELHGFEHGLPMTFTPFNVKKGVIRESTDMNIKFSAGTTCPRYSTVWKLGGYDKVRGHYFVTSGGVEGNPGAKTTSNWFKIEKYDEDYKLVFCPAVCKYCNAICKDVGIFMENGRRILALTDVAPLKVRFMKS